MSNYPFTFPVVVYHGYDKETGESSYHRQQGMGFADSFAQAAGIIENYYGSELINIQKLELFEEADSKINSSYILIDSDEDGKLLDNSNIDFLKLLKTLGIY
jgi:hypothetical protein